MRIRVLLASCLIVLTTAAVAAAESFDRIVVFGDSLSDPGNHFTAFKTTAQAPFAPLPDASYARGGHHFSNGATWIEELSEDLDMAAGGKPALRAAGVFTNYAVGRARARRSSARHFLVLNIPDPTLAPILSGLDPWTRLRAGCRRELQRRPGRDHALAPGHLWSRCARLRRGGDARGYGHHGR